MAVATSTAILGGAAIAGAGAVAGGLIGARGAERAAEAQTQGAERAAEIQLIAQREAIEAQRELFDITREDLAPYRERGAVALADLAGLNRPGGYFQQDFDFTLADFEADPGYQFRLMEGMRALERSAAARGGLISGRTLRDVQRFGQGLASEEFQRAYGREFGEFFANREARFNRLAAQAGIGQIATTDTGRFAQQTGGGVAQTILAGGANLAELQLQAANARASGYAGGARAWQGALQGVSQLPLQAIALSQLAGRS